MSAIENVSRRAVPRRRLLRRRLRARRARAARHPRGRRRRSCPHAGGRARRSTRASISASSPTARSSSSRTAPRWAPASGRRCRWWRPTSSTPTGAASRIEQGIGDPQYGDQNTDGSRSIRDFYEAFRHAGASARSMLVSAAAAQWNVPGVANARREPRSRPRQRAAAGSATARSCRRRPSCRCRRPRSCSSSRRPRGASSARSSRIYDQTDIITGKAQFGLDVFRDGMVHASIEHPPVFGGTVRSVDDKAALTGEAACSRRSRSTRSSRRTVFQPLGGVAVIADNTWAALQGRKQLKVEWNDGPHASFESEAFKKELLATVAQPGKVARNLGNVDAEFAKGGKVLEATYYTPLAGARVDGAAGGGGRIPRRQGHGLGADAESAGGAGHGGRGARHRQEGRHLPRDAARRRLRPEVEAGLLRRSGRAVEEARQAGQGDLDARGRHPLRLLPHDGGGLSQGGGGRPRQADRVAAAIGVPADRVDVRSEGAQRRSASSSTWGSSTCRTTCRTSAPRTARPTRTCASAGSAPSATTTTRSRRTASPTRWRRRPGATRSSSCSTCSGRARCSISRRRASTTRTTARRSTSTRSTRGGCAACSRSPARRRAGASGSPGGGWGIGIAAHRSFNSYVASVVEVEVDAQGRGPRSRGSSRWSTPGVIVNPDRVRAQLEGAAVMAVGLARPARSPPPTAGSSRATSTTSRWRG